MPRKRLSDYSSYTVNEVIGKVNQFAREKSTKSLEVVAQRIAEIPEYSCTINIRPGESLDIFLAKWTQKFINGWENRPSNRNSNPIGTQHDPIIDEIISSRISIVSEELNLIKYGHRLSMSAENIAGSLLEEYLARELLKYNWHCCWGETMKSIDFCNENGELLQVKNSDNSENSSSKAVRDGTKIKHWFRRISRTGKTNWKALNHLVGINNPSSMLSEESFRNFVRNAVLNNPDSVYLEEESPWYGIKRS